MTESKTINDVLVSGSMLLTDAATARLDCEILLAHIIGKDRNYFYSHPESVISAAHIADFNSMLLKRARGYPVAYLLGQKEFWSLPFTVDSNTLVPRPETERLVEIALELIPPDTTLNVLDLGTGSGAIAVSVAAERTKCTVTATDICPYALARARENTGVNAITGIQFIESDWFENIGPTRYDIILSNPPYVESDNPGFINGEIRYEPRLALDGGPRGLDAYYRIIPAATRHLNASGYLVLEHGYLQGGILRNMLEQNHYKNIETRSDYSGLERITLARYS